MSRQQRVYLLTLDVDEDWNDDLLGNYIAHVEYPLLSDYGVQRNGGPEGTHDGYEGPFVHRVIVERVETGRETTLTLLRRPVRGPIGTPSLSIGVWSVKDSGLLEPASTSGDD